ECLRNIRNLLQRIMELQAENGPAARLKSAGVLLDILFEIYTGFSETGDISSDYAAGRRNRERLSAVMAYTEEHYQEPISLDDVAKELHLQVNYFCRIFKENTGMTYLQYLNEYRLGKIYQDLMETDIPLKYLLEKHGFTNYKLFRRMFSDHFGTTPGELRFSR
ncbi:MAG: helix-turn-helix transcriptional regulator, partial [bacterium]